MTACAGIAGHSCVVYRLPTPTAHSIIIWLVYPVRPAYARIQPHKATPHKRMHAHPTAIKLPQGLRCGHLVDGCGIAIATAGAIALTIYAARRWRRRARVASAMSMTATPTANGLPAEGVGEPRSLRSPTAAARRPPRSTKNDAIPVQGLSSTVGRLSGTGAGSVGPPRLSASVDGSVPMLQPAPQGRPLRAPAPQQRFLRSDARPLDSSRPPSEAREEPQASLALHPPVPQLLPAPALALPPPRLQWHRPARQPPTAAKSGRQRRLRPGS